jgi:hypothetical protein
VLNRRLASLLAAVTVAGLAATGCSSPASTMREQSAAVRVDDRTVSRSDFEDSLDLFYENDDLRAFLFEATKDQLRAEDGPRDSYLQEYVGAVAGVQVQFLVVAEALEEQDIVLTDADREAIVQQLDQSLPGGFDSLPSGLRDDIVDGFAGFDKLRSELGEEEFNVVIGEVVDASDIDVSSRYGSWDADQFQVVPPSGPAPAPGTADESPQSAPG